MPVPAVMNLGIPTVSAGSQIVTAGISAGWKMIFFLWVALLVSTPARPTSDPVPAVVGTAMIGAIFAASARVYQSSISSRSQTLRSAADARHQRDHLAQVQRRAAAKADHAVMLARQVDGDPVGHVLLVRVRVHVREHRAAKAGGLSSTSSAAAVIGRLASALSVTSSGAVSPMDFA
jgi:hypothetical protein